jgi:hypothetical protein
MTTPDDSNRPDPGRRHPDVDAVFADLVSSMPDLASIDPPVRDDDLEVVELVFPLPDGSGEPMRLVLAVPPQVAASIRAEFGPDRVAAMLQAIEALATLSDPPRP